jgi:MerR family transcriptional regulator, light-induced transcriptional regulator
VLKKSTSVNIKGIIMIETDKIDSDFLNALLEGNRNASSKIIFDLLKSGRDIKDVYENVIKPSLYQVGELWEYNKISVATEHLASAIVEAILNELYHEVISKEKKAGKVIVSCVEKEYHQIGIKMVSDIFEANGWNSYFLGANTPAKELISFAKIIKPDIIAISMSIYFHLPTLVMMIQKIRAELPDIPILVGGQAFSRGGQDTLKKYSNVIYLRDLYSIDAFIKN